MGRNFATKGKSLSKSAFLDFFLLLTSDVIAGWSVLTGTSLFTVLPILSGRTRNVAKDSSPTRCALTSSACSMASLNENEAFDKCHLAILRKHTWHHFDICRSIDSSCRRNHRRTSPRTASLWSQGHRCMLRLLVHKMHRSNSHTLSCSLDRMCTLDKDDGSGSQHNQTCKCMIQSKGDSCKMRNCKLVQIHGDSSSSRHNHTTPSRPWLIKPRKRRGSWLFLGINSSPSRRRDQISSTEKRNESNRTVGVLRARGQHFGWIRTLFFHYHPPDSSYNQPHTRMRTKTDGMGSLKVHFLNG